MADEEFKTVLKIEGDASGAIAAIRQAKAEHAQLAAQTEADNAAMAAGPSLRQAEPEHTQLPATVEADSAAVAADGRVGATSGKGMGLERIRGLAGLLSLINPAVGAFTSLGTHVVSSLQAMWDRSKGIMTNFSSIAPGLFAIGTTGLITAAKAFCDSMVEQARRFQEEQAGIKKGAMELQAAVREELGKRGIAGEEETASARAKAGQLERLGFGREVAVQAAAVGVQQGLSDDQLIQLAAGLKAGQVNIEGSKAQVQRKLSTFYKGTLGRSEAASTNAAIIQQTIATREDSLEESLRQERKAIQESQKSVWEMGPGEFVSYIAIGRRNMEELAPRQTELGALGDARRAAAERAVPQPAALQRAAQSARGGPPSVIINSYGTLNLSKNGLDAKVPRAPGL